LAQLLEDFQLSDSRQAQFEHVQSLRHQTGSAIIRLQSSPLKSMGLLCPFLLLSMVPLLLLVLAHAWWKSLELSSQAHKEEKE